ncbi:class I SAM-dependent methyltransferase [Gryllotalpicola ginsengisoli]|uniref:class I SAM-dependent methyltransferase n=1 Tax=Gryllotalpicola ginsengisoli TaxID=444608 RepID=UPI0003B54777|nr:class I SAM-dependent methyltransferase [Gryllotalpicola ginsengisoli]
MPDDLDSDHRARLAAVYDPLDPDRSDLEVYADIVAEFRARRVLDVGCGTGTFALMLAGRGIRVVAVDPDEASVDLARHKPGADAVEWIVGDATTLPALSVELATMTANVAQVFLDDAEWEATLRGIREALVPGGVLVFESRRPERRAWEEWTPERTRVSAEVEGYGHVEAWNEVLEVAGPLVTFRSTNAFDDGTTLVVEETLRWRTREELEASLAAAGFEVLEVRDAPDRPGREYVFIARAVEGAED